MVAGSSPAGPTISLVLMPEDTVTFNSFQFDPRIASAISEMGYVTPTPIQAKAIPPVMQGKDVMGAAQTGTGKTAGYGLPALNRVLPKANTSASPARHPVRVLVLTPTRELADQVNENLKAYAKNTPLRVGVVFGGVDIKPQQVELMRGVEILTATPGRLLDHIEGHTVNLSQAEIVILDEADRMLDMGFLPDISRILKLLPTKRQSLMFSATFSPEIKKLAKNFLIDPVYVEVARQNSVADTVEQVLLKVDEDEKTNALIEILQNGYEDRTPAESVLVFVNSKLVCRRLARTLERQGLTAEAIHGDKTQEERMETLERFKEGQCKVLVATDVAARGLDIAQLPCVINYDVPFSAEDYVHRIGRTGRAGAKGLALMLATSSDLRNVSAIEHLTKQKFPVTEFSVPRRLKFSRNNRPNREEDHEGRKIPLANPLPEMPYDPIFDAPYVASKELPKKEKIEPSEEIRPKKKTVRVSALLGGFPH